MQMSEKVQLFDMKWFHLGEWRMLAAGLTADEWDDLHKKAKALYPHRMIYKQPARTRGV